MNNISVITVSEEGIAIARKIASEIPDAEIYTRNNEETYSLPSAIEKAFNEKNGIIFIGAMGICVRLISPYLKDKYTDPAVVCIDCLGRYVIPVISGHVGGANQLSERISRIIGAEPVITTQSDIKNLWGLDTIGRKFGWEAEPVVQIENTCSYGNTAPEKSSMNKVISLFVAERPTALILDIRDNGTEYLERTLPSHVEVFYSFYEFQRKNTPEPDSKPLFELVIAVTPYYYKFNTTPVLYYRPKVLNIGIGCKKNCISNGVPDMLINLLKEKGVSYKSVKSISTIDLKKDEPLIHEVANKFGVGINIYKADELKDIVVPNPSEKAFQVTGVYGVAESTSIKASNYGNLVVEKQKVAISKEDQLTYAVAIDREAGRHGHIEIIGAGPGDPELVSVRGKHFLQKADLILYAGSLVPVELTYYAKKGATVRSSASMDLEEQFSLMKSFYDKGLLIARLHTGDPCIYGAIQEQMAYFDRYNMSYHITPGISAFQAAAAAMRSQFTIPEEVQTIILTRGEGRTPMPEREQLHKLAQSQSTMCIYLSTDIVEKVQSELLQVYPPETPVAVCHKLTWKDEKIFRGTLNELTRLVRDNNLRLTTLLVVSKAIDNREGLSRLYASEFKHLFRK